MILDINDKTGQATLLIPDADGEEHAYLFPPIRPGISVEAWAVTRTDTGASYRVAFDGAGRWSCGCPAQEFRKRGAEDCKHLQALRPFYLWITQYLAAQAAVSRPALPSPAEIDHVA